MTEAHAHEHAEKAPAKKRATRKKVVHVKTHAELELDSFKRQWEVAIREVPLNMQHVVALEKKINRREFQITMQSVAKG